MLKGCQELAQPNRNRSRSHAWNPAVFFLKRGGHSRASQIKPLYAPYTRRRVVLYPVVGQMPGVCQGAGEGADTLIWGSR